MSFRRLAPAFALIPALALGACDSTGGAKQSIGTDKPAVTGLGTLAGTFAGGSVGKTLDTADRAAAQSAEQRAYTAPLGEIVAWNNPQSGNRGTVTPTRDGYSGTGSYCREFQQSVTVGGRQQRGFGTACRQPDGTWKLMSE